MLTTEQRNPKTTHLDKMTSLEIVQVMNEENAYSVACLTPALPQIARAIDAIAEAFSQGGRLFYMGAGTSGRLAVVDSAECPPTFGVPREQVVGIIAGGLDAMIHASENAEDDPNDGVRELKQRELTALDVVVGISAAGGAAFVCNALKYAQSLGCTTIGITSNPGSKLDTISDISIAVDTGAEVLTGSTRLKAGNAQKMILNMLSTGAMVRSGYVYENLMINLKPTNIKLRGRVIRIVSQITGYDEMACVDLLEKSNWVIRDALQLWKQQA
ncbi:MAG: N-acetylmuramic acid 6-phosphate etherase [Ruminococcaceae bacterium]|nr:N-acetylmuramic acid 6-phosphate etherase [Oscillospiraceae bacterium]